MSGLSPGFALTFDDDYVDEWYSLRPLLDRHAVRATFFVTRAHRLSEEAKARLRTLAAEGHEIGAHGFEHRGVVYEYASDPARAVEYERDEVIPALRALNEMGLAPKNYAFPYGQHAPAYTEAVLRHFGKVRLTGHKRRGLPLHFNLALYCRKQRAGDTQGAIILDDLFSPSRAELRRLFKTARAMNWVVCFFAHKPGKIDPQHTQIDDDEAYRLDPDTLDWVLSEAKSFGLRSYTFDELSA